MVVAMAIPLHETLRQELLARIEDGRWPEGYPIPSEARLREEFGVSRGPVRQALATLRESGHLEGGQGRPPVVVRSVPAQTTDVFASFTEWAESLGRVPGQRTHEIARRPAGEEIADRLGLDPADHVVTVTRLRLLDGEPTMVERTAFLLDVGASLLGFDADSGSIYRHLTEQGVELVRATHVIDAVAADALDAELLGVPEGSPLLRERRTTVDDAHRTVEYSDDRYLSDRATFVVTNHRSATSRLGLTPVEPGPRRTSARTPATVHHVHPTAGSDPAAQPTRSPS